MTRFKLILRNVALLVVILVGLVSIMGKTPPTTPTTTPNSCPNLSLAVLKQPTAAMAWQWDGVGAGADRVHVWGMINRASHEEVTNPNVGELLFPGPNGWRGLVFTMSLEHHPDYGWNKSSGDSVVYLMEYTLPAPGCDSKVDWDTRLSFTLPHGLCVTNSGLTQCDNNAVVRADFQLITLNDPTGAMGVSGSGRALLENAVKAKLGEPRTDGDYLLISGITPTKQSIYQPVTGSFTVRSGVQSHIYVGVAAQMIMFNPGEMCLYKCGNHAELQEHGAFLVEGGTEGVIGIGMAPATP